MRAAFVMLLASAAVPAGAAETPRFALPPSVSACPEQGPGFVRIPGSETCIRIAGRVRSEYGVVGRRVLRDDVAGFGTRGSVSADVRTPTAYGPLRGFVRLRAGGGPVSRD